jgi:hypothetical protein
MRRFSSHTRSAARINRRARSSLPPKAGGDGSLWTIFDSCGTPSLFGLLARRFDEGLGDFFFACGRLNLGLDGMASCARLRFAINSWRSLVKTWVGRRRAA